MKKLNYIILAAAMALPVSAQAQSQITFSGNLTSISSTAPFWTGISVGDPFTVTATFNGTPTHVYSGSIVGIFDWQNQPYSISASFGSYLFSMNNVRLEVRDFPDPGGQHGFIFGNAEYFSSGGLQFNSVNAFQAYVLSGLNDMITTTDVSAVQNYSISHFESRSFGLYNGTFNGGVDTASVSGTINSFAIAPVPEPSTLALAGMGGLGLFFARRRCK